MRYKENYVEAVSCSDVFLRLEDVYEKVFQHIPDMSSYLTLLSHELKESGFGQNIQSQAQSSLLFFANQRVACYKAVSVV